MEESTAARPCIRPSEPVANLRFIAEHIFCCLDSSTVHHQQVSHSSASNVSSRSISHDLADSLLRHRALMNPASLTDRDVTNCGDTLSSILAWTVIMENVLGAGPCVPYHYFIYSQFVLHLLSHVHC